MFKTILIGMLLTKAASVPSQNLAIHRPATMRDHRDNNGPEKAVDGSPNTHLGSNNCVHTSPTGSLDPAWFTVDLLATYNIGYISILNRGDCCRKRIKKTHVLVTPDGARSGPTVQECNFIKAGWWSPVITVTCLTPLAGRYITLLRNESAPEANVMNFCEIEVYGNLAENLAIHKVATQRDATPDRDADKAVDGITNGDMAGGSCMHTLSVHNGAPAGSQAWFTVDLNGIFTVRTVRIYNRVDCCQDRLKDTRVLVSSNGEREGADVEECAYIGDEGLQNIITVDCVNPTDARYVSLVRNVGALDEEVMNICEVQVFESPQGNIALGKPTTERDFHPNGWSAANVVDGVNNGNINGGSCFHTANNVNAGPAWMNIDLMGTYTIHTVRIHNRRDCCQDRLPDTHIKVSTNGALSGAGVETCAYIGTEGNFNVVTKVCASQPQGRYVTLVRDDSGFAPHVMNICEVRVYETPVGNLAKGKPAKQRDATENRDADKAVDGNTNSQMSGGSCMHTQNVDTGLPAWFTVDLLASFSIQSVMVYNRADCCKERLTDTYVYVNTIEDVNGPNRKTCAYIGSEGVEPVVTKHCTSPHPEGRYVSLLRDSSGYQPYLMNICEVFVFGAPV